MNLLTRLFASTCVVVLAAYQAVAQGPPTSFEAVSIKLRTGDPVFGRGPSAPDRFERDAPLEELIRYAYGVNSFQLIGGPGWIRSKRWDVSAKAPAPAEEPAMRQLVRRMLEDRFALKTHVEMRDLPVYQLVLARSDGQLGPKITPAAVDCTPFLVGTRPMSESPRDEKTGIALCLSGAAIGAGGVITPRLNGQPLTGLVARLEAALQRQVIDKTGLLGNFDIALSYVDERVVESLARDGARLPVSNAPPLFTALQEQLGMKLESSRGQVNVLVVDSASEPTIN